MVEFRLIVLPMNGQLVRIDRQEIRLTPIRHCGSAGRSLEWTGEEATGLR